MHRKITTLTREELYQRVWQVPISRLAESFGLSDRGLSKLCERHDIPTPQRGYWARLEAGQKVARTPLPPAIGNASKTIDIQASDQPAASVVEARTHIAKVEKEIGEVDIPDTFRGLHWCVAAWVEEHRADQDKGRKDRKLDGDVFGTWPPRGNLTERDRYRFQVTSAFLKACEAHGAIVAEAKLKGHLVLMVNGERLECRIVEKMIQKPTYGRDKSGWTAFPEHHNGGLSSSGFLKLAITTYPVTGKDLIETRDKRAAQLLPSFVARVIAAGPLLFADRKAKEEAADRRRIEMAQRAEQQRIARIEQERWERFLVLANNHHVCTKARRFIDSLRAAPHLIGAETDGRTTEEWLIWAEEKIATANPVDWPLEKIFGTQYRGYSPPDRPLN